MAKVYTVHARWDEAAKIWATPAVVEIPGLFCQAESFDQLVEIILDLAPDLLRANGAEPAGQLVDIRIVAERHPRGRCAQSVDDQDRERASGVHQPALRLA